MNCRVCHSLALNNRAISMGGPSVSHSANAGGAYEATGNHPAAAGSIRMAVGLAHPCRERGERGVATGTVGYRDAPLRPWPREVLVLEGVVKADLARILEAGAKHDT